MLDMVAIRGAGATGYLLSKRLFSQPLNVVITTVHTLHSLSSYHICSYQHPWFGRRGQGGAGGGKAGGVNRFIFLGSNNVKTLNQKICIYTNDFLKFASLQDPV